MFGFCPGGAHMIDLSSLSLDFASYMSTYFLMDGSKGSIIGIRHPSVFTRKYLDDNGGTFGSVTVTKF